MAYPTLQPGDLTLWRTKRKLSPGPSYTDKDIDFIGVDRSFYPDKVTKQCLLYDACSTSSFRPASPHSSGDRAGWVRATGCVNDSRRRQSSISCRPTPLRSTPFVPPSCVSAMAITAA